MPPPAPAWNWHSDIGHAYFTFELIAARVSWTTPETATLELRDESPLAIILSLLIGLSSASLPLQLARMRVA